MNWVGSVTSRNKLHCGFSKYNLTLFLLKKNTVKLTVLDIMYYIIYYTLFRHYLLQAFCLLQKNYETKITLQSII